MLFGDHLKVHKNENFLITGTLYIGTEKVKCPPSLHGAKELVFGSEKGQEWLRYLLLSLQPLNFHVLDSIN